MRIYIYALALLAFSTAIAQKKKEDKKIIIKPVTASVNLDTLFKQVRFRSIGPFRGGRSVTSTGVIQNQLVYYMGSASGGVWKTEDAGQTWHNVSDGYFKTGSVGAVAVAESDPNVVYVGMGEHAPRGVMSSYGDGIYKSTDAGKTWMHLGLEKTRSVANIRIHPQNSDIAYVAAQGAMHGATPDRGVYKTIDGGKTWKKTLYVDENTGCVDLSMDMNNPRILYAAMWDYRRLPWEMRSGGKGSGLYKSVDGGETWFKMEKGLPKEMGKMSISVSRANGDKVYALIESDTQKEAGGLFVSDDAGKSWNRVSKDHRLTQRAWYYIEVFADPKDENTVYVLNSPGLKSTDGGKTWNYLGGIHGDFHQLWINPNNNKNMIVSNDGGAGVTFNAGKVWSTEANQPTAQFYRISVDNLFPYNIYAGQQDNSSVKIKSWNPSGWQIDQSDWTYSAGGESAFIAFDPNNPRYSMGGSYQGTIGLFDQETMEGKSIMVAPIQYQSLQPKDMKYRFNWNAPITYSEHEPNTFYHAGNVLFKTTDYGKNWVPISPDLTKHDTTKMGMSGTPYTNEGAGGENYCTIMYVKESPIEKGVIYTGSDDGVVSITKDNGASWNNITPPDLGEAIVNCIDISPFDKATAYIATTRYKFNDFTPSLYKTTDYGKTWKKITEGIPDGAYTRCIREDQSRKGLLFAGTETGLYISFNGGAHWQQLQLGLPIVPITDLKIHQGNLIAATMGRAFWILDDLQMLRQFDSTKNDQFQLFQPRDTYRVSGASSLDKVFTDEELETPLQGSAGLNAPTGVILYYQLPSKKDSAAKYTLEIKDSKGNLVRKYAAEADKDFVGGYPGGPSPDPLLPTASGVNRFVWDLRYPPQTGVMNVFIEGGYDGHKVAPGDYSATLKFGKEIKTVSFKILADPRIKGTASEYEEQHILSSKVEAGIVDIHSSVNKMRKLNKQIMDLNEQLEAGDTIANKSIRDKAITISKTLNKWEEALVQTKAQSNDDIINYINKLSADYIFLKGELDSNIPYTTKGQQDQYLLLDKQWQGLKKQMQELVNKDIAELNKLCKEKEVLKIITRL